MHFAVDEDDSEPSPSTSAALSNGAISTDPTPGSSSSKSGNSANALEKSSIQDHIEMSNKAMLSIDEAEKLIAEISDTGNVHNFFICKDNDCSSFKDGKVAVCKGNDKFKHAWLQEKKNWWAVFDENVQGTYCLLCRKHSSKSALNKSSNKFVDCAAVRFKPQVLPEHLASGIHSASASNELMQRNSVLHKEYTHKEEHKKLTFEKVFTSVYFCMKEHLSNNKFIPLIELMEKCGVSELRHFDHRSQGSIKDFFLTLGETVQESFLDDLKNGDTYGLMVDETTDISTLNQMITFIHFIDKEGKATVKFLSVENLLEEFDSANAEAIFETMKSVLSQRGIDFMKMTGFTSDGANVMVGRRNGVAAKIVSENSKCITVHCVCHRLALACVGANKDLTYIKTIETTLRQLWQWFENSAKRLTTFLKIQKNLKQATAQMSDATEQIFIRCLKKACATRWLSFDKSVNSLKKEYISVLQTLNLFAERDAAASGLLAKLCQAKFVGSIYVLNEILTVSSRSQGERENPSPSST